MNPNPTHEIRLTRVYAASVRAVWDAWTIPEQVEKWWGPRGFTLTTHSKDLRAGGTWRYTMHGPDGVDYPNVTTYHVVEPHRRLVYDHGGSDDRPPLFRVAVTFSERNGKTTMEMVSTLASPEAAREIAHFIKQVGGTSTWDRLGEYLTWRSDGTHAFVITRTFAAPADRVFAMWSTPEHLSRWLPPKGSTLRFLRDDLRPGASALMLIEGAHGSMYVRTEYLIVDPPKRIVYTQQFVDADERPTPAPGTEAWPPVLRNEVVFVEEAPGITRVTLTTEPHERATAEQALAFTAERSGMAAGWTGSFDALDGLLGGDGVALGAQGYVM